MTSDKADITKIDMIARHLMRKILRCLGKVSIRERENAFIFRSLGHIYSLSPSATLQVMDIGSSSSFLPWRLARRGYKVIAVDTRTYPFRHRNLTFLKADITIPDFWDDLPNVDVVTCVSTLEHIGVGHYGDRLAENGDQVAAATFHRVLKPGGFLLLTVPFSGSFSQDDFQRIYNPETIFKLFPSDWRLREERYYIPKARRNWIEATQAEALKPYKVYPASNNACFWFEKI